MKVTKNRLAKLVLSRARTSRRIGALLKGPTILAYQPGSGRCGEGRLATFAKAHDKLVILGGAHG